MTDIDVKPEWVEKAVRALVDSGLADDDGDGYILENVYAQGAVHTVLAAVIDQIKAEVLDERAVKLAETSIHTSHATGQALSRCVDLVEHIAKDEVIREAKAEALREAATAYQWGGWARNPQARGDLGVKRQQAEHAVKWLRDLADGIDQEADNE